MNSKYEIMKKTLLTLIAAMLVFASNIKAQEHELDSSKRERLQAMKIAYLTQKLDLAPKEAEVFWPIYNELDKQMREVKQEQKLNMRTTRKNFETMSDMELEQAVLKGLDLEQRQVDLKREYTDRFKKALPIRKVVLLHGAEQGFRKELLRSSKEMRRPGQPKRSY